MTCLVHTVDSRNAESAQLELQVLSSGHMILLFLIAAFDYMAHCTSIEDEQDKIITSGLRTFMNKFTTSQSGG